jgi:hypothetical protein
MDIPQEIIYEIVYFLDVYDICSFSCTSKKSNVFHHEHLWKMKCNGIKTENKTYMDTYIGDQIPVILHGDFLKYIRIKGDQIFPTCNHFIILNTKNGAPLQYILPNERICKYLPGENGNWHASVNGIIIDRGYINIALDKSKANILREIVDEQTYSAKSKIPIYGYTVDYWNARDGQKEVFNILENVSLIPKIIALKDIKKENKMYKFFDGIRLTKIHSLESILRHFMTEKEITLLTEEEMRVRVRKELELIHHILPNKIGWN